MAKVPLRVVRNHSSLFATAVEALLDEPRSTVPVTVTPLDDKPGGPRVVSSAGSGLVLGIANIDQIDTLTAYEHFQVGGGYSCISHWCAELPFSAIRPGETVHLPRRIGEHRAAPPCAFEHMLLVGSANPIFAPFGRDETVALQWILYALAESAGRVALHGAPPARPMMLDHNPHLLRQWVRDLRTLLSATGVMAWEPRGATVGRIVDQPEERGPVRAVLQGYETNIPPGLTEREGAVRYDLVWDRIHALVTVVDDWTIIHAGSTANPDDRSGIRSCIAAKRADLLAKGVVQRMQCGLWRFTRDTAVPSLTNAVRTITGTNARDGLFRLAA